MSKYYNSDEVDSALEKLEDAYSGTSFIAGIYTAHNRVREIPAADVAPVVHAHWIRHERAEEVEGIFISNYECSHCHEWFRDNRGRCGECGAKMDEDMIEDEH